jgi:hypothetical protein
MPKSEASRYVANEFEKTLPQYQEAFQAFIDANQETYLAGSTPVEKPGMPSFRQQDNDDGSPVLTGLRFKLFSLALIAGSLELKSSEKIVGEIIHLAISQKRTYVDSGQYDLVFSFVVIVEASLYNTTILGSFLYGAHRGDPTLQAKLQEYSRQWKLRKLVTHTARATEFDLHRDIVL